MQFKKILVPIDFSHFSKKALYEAVKLVGCCGGKIFLLHVGGHLSYEANP